MQCRWYISENVFVTFLEIIFTSRCKCSDNLKKNICRLWQLQGCTKPSQMKCLDGLSVYLPVCLSVYRSICLSVCLSIYPSVCMSVCLSLYLSIPSLFHPSIFLFHQHSAALILFCNGWEACGWASALGPETPCILWPASCSCILWPASCSCIFWPASCSYILWPASCSSLDIVTSFLFLLSNLSFCYERLMTGVWGSGLSVMTFPAPTCLSPL